MKVYLGIPMYGGAGGEFISSLLQTRIVLDRCGYEVEVDLHCNHSILPKARNEITQRFADSGFDKLLFLDSDMVFSAVDIVNLLRVDKDLCCINYRAKTDELKWMAVTNGEEENGLIKAEYAGTGIMAISRECILSLQRNYPDLEYSDKGNTYFALFDFLLKDGRYYGEDYTFCDRWKGIGGELWLMPDCSVGHVGQKVYEGRFVA